MGLQGCHASHPLPLYPPDFRTDPGAGANPRPAWLPGTERRCSAGGALWESEACEQGVGGTECVCLCCGVGVGVSFWNTRPRSTIKYCPVSPSCLFFVLCLAHGLPYSELLVINIWNPSLLFYGIKEVCIQRPGDVAQFRELICLAHTNLWVQSSVLHKPGGT